MLFQFRVWVFPEGTRSVKAELLPFKKGAFHMAIQAQIPLVCVVASSYANFYSKRERRFDLDGQVRVRVLEPVQTRGLTIDAVNELATKCRDLMQAEFDALNKEMNIDVGATPKYMPPTTPQKETGDSGETTLRRRDLNNNPSEQQLIS